MKKLSILTSLMISGLLFSAYSYGGDQDYYCDANNYMDYIYPDPETGLNANTTKLIEQNKGRGLVATGCDFSKIPLWWFLSFSNTDLRYSYFSYHNLSGIDFSGANMSNATVKRCVLNSDTKLHNTIMKGSQWNSTKLDGVNFANADIIDAMFTSSSLQATDMSDVIYDPKSEHARFTFLYIGYNSLTQLPKDAILFKQYMVNCDEEEEHTTCNR